MRPRRTTPFAVCAAIAIFATTGDAEAYEYQWRVGLNVGYSVLSGTPVAHGYGGGLHLSYGLTDAFNAISEVDVTLHPGGDAIVGNAGLGVAYVIDILEWIPYVGIMAGPYDVWSTADNCDAPVPPMAPPGTQPGPDCSDLRLGVSIPVGLDYQVSSSFAVGAAARYHILLGGDQSRAVISAFARAEYIWGF